MTTLMEEMDFGCFCKALLKWSMASAYLSFEYATMPYRSDRSVSCVNLGNVTIDLAYSIS
jgi:hypothetical protein